MRHLLVSTVFALGATPLVAQAQPAPAADHPAPAARHRSHAGKHPAHAAKDPAHAATPPADEPPAADAAPTPPAKAKWKHKKKHKKLAISGYVQPLFTYTFDTNGDGAKTADALELKRVRLKAKGQVWGKIGYDIMFDPSTPGNLLRDAYVSLGYIPHAQIRIGQQKTQFGYENPESSTRLWTIDRAYPSGALGHGSDLRDIGVGLLGHIPAIPMLRIEYALTVVNGAGPNVKKAASDWPSVWGRIGPTWIDHQRHIKARLGGSFATGRVIAAMTPTYDFTRFGADVEVDTPWFFAAFEYLMGKDTPTGGSSVNKRGFYVMLVGKTPWHAGGVLKYERYDPNLKTAGDLSQRTTIGGYWDISKPLRLLADFEIDQSSTKKDDRLLVFGQVKF